MKGILWEYSSAQLQVYRRVSQSVSNGDSLHVQHLPGIQLYHYIPYECGKTIFAKCPTLNAGPGYKMWAYETHADPVNDTKTQKLSVNMDSETQAQKLPAGSKSKKLDWM